MLSENVHTSSHTNGVCLPSEDVSKQIVFAIVIVITFNVIVIDYIVILFIRNRAGGK